MYKGTGKLRDQTDHLIATLEARRQWSDAFKILEGKSLNHIFRLASFQKFYFPYFQREASERCALLKYEEMGIHRGGEVKGILRPK